ncbi:NSS family neurotransmitter:Na+ symporter [Virgibacillus natechei]|uniref:Transporter n=1 Tax=Virgibacillus natechei TaxID=1216297 RepID=A0ABS4IJX7_9BACI|nr:sodium-dependent transporter [Virgibacillus natechei]MBP1970641.1 NSS family neurotransmitter:Na+ symporter [Virgibacillus natechei]UZD13972.1 sodium-dependent transporter [Virgibacillus natechei]
MPAQKDQWSTKLGFILSSAGAAIGLGAIWKFPYMTGMNGGGAFFLLFILFTIIIGLPILLAEFIIGRGSQKEAISAYQTLAPKSGWSIIGRWGVVGAFLLMSFYSVVGGWVLIYSALSIPGMIIQDNTDYSELFATITENPLIVIVGLASFLIINIAVVSLGIKNGIEKASKLLMPLLFIFFIIIVIRALTFEGAMEGVTFFLQPDFSMITTEGVLYALGQSFFSLAVGFSVMVTYSSYLNKDISLPMSAGSVSIMNIIVSFLAGLAIFPVVFSFGLEPAEGPGLLFIVLPEAFAQMPFGELFLSLFLLLFLFAIMTSSFSMLEIITSAFTEGKQRSRRKVAVIAGSIVFLAGIPAALSSNVLADFTIFGLTVFDATDYLVSNILLPGGCLLIALFIGFKMDKTLMIKEFAYSNKLSTGLYEVWFQIMRWVAPITIIIVFLSTIFDI